MWWAVGLLLLAQWVLGLASSATLGNWIHLMLALSLLSFVLAAALGPTRGRAKQA